MILIFARNSRKKARKREIYEWNALELRVDRRAFVRALIVRGELGRLFRAGLVHDGLRGLLLELRGRRRSETKTKTKMRHSAVECEQEKTI